MSIVPDYRVEAIWCRAMAAKEANPKVKRTMLRLARQFDEMAEQRDQCARPDGKGLAGYGAPPHAAVVSVKSR